MADKKITEVTAYTSPISTDLVPIVDVTNGITKSITADAFLNNSLYRQAIINGNFDVWQRGVSFTNPGLTTYTTDRFATNAYDAGGGTLPTNIIHSRQLVTPGELDGSKYFYRINPDGAGTSLGADSSYGLQQRIENGTSKLCGNGKTVTISFYAKSDITGKRLGISLVQSYGSGGSPSSAETIAGTNFTLTSSWTKYSYTFTTNTLSGKTFGTDNNDYLRVSFNIVWGSTTKSSYGSSTPETFVGSGNIDIAQVQLNAGSVALPFQPKSYAEELRDCQRYYVQLNGDNFYIPPSAVSSTTAVYFPLLLTTPMRILPLVTMNGSRGTNWLFKDSSNNTNTTGTLVSQSVGKNSLINIVFNTGTFTAGLSYTLILLDSTSSLNLSSEL